MFKMEPRETLIVFAGSPNPVGRVNCGDLVDKARAYFDAAGIDIKMEGLNVVESDGFLEVYDSHKNVGYVFGNKESIDALEMAYVRGGLSTMRWTIRSEEGDVVVLGFSGERVA